MIPRTRDPWGCFGVFVLALLIALFIWSAIAGGCAAAPARPERHTWGELGFTDAFTGKPVEMPISPEVWEEIERGRLQVAPEEPSRTMPADRWLVWRSAATR